VQSLNDLWLGIAKHKWKTITYIFTCFSVLFTIVKAVTQFFPSVKIAGPTPLMAAIVISCCWGLWKIWKPSKVSIKIAHSSTCLEIVFGDLFVQDGIRAIGVSEFFETQLGQPVSDKSLHGAFLKRHFPAIKTRLINNSKVNSPTSYTRKCMTRSKVSRFVIT
jgi:Thoeris protein ThsA, Macro domain